jgi:hypothetical protein
MSVNLSPVAGAAAQFLDNAGNVLTGGKLFTYLAGTTTPAAVYTSSTGITFHSNPIILDAAGRVPAGGEIWLSDNISYKFVLKDANDVLIATWDNIIGINSNFVNYTIQEEIQTATAGQTVFNLATVTYAPGTNSLQVFVDGVNQYDGVSYAFVETNANTVTFTSGLHVGALVKFTTAVPATGTATNANVVVYDPAGTGAVTTTVQTKLREIVSPEDFGAVGDGVTDDTVALQNWINANGGIHMLGDESKTYIVAPAVANDVILPIPTGSKRNIVGNGATIKIKNNSLGFYSIIGSNSLLVDLTQTIIDGVVFDYNRANNTYAVSSGLLTFPRYTFSALNGADIRFSNNLIKNAVCTNSVFANGSDGLGNVFVDRPVISDNTWTSVGAGATSAYDHSTIYTNATYEQIYNNAAFAEAANAFGTACFIETHGTGTLVYSNHSVDFQGFANITGVRSAGDTENVLVYGNKAESIQFGIRMLSLANSPHTTGFGLNNINVYGNNFRIKQTLLAAGTSRFHGGIFIQPGATLPVKNINIFDNTILFDSESVAGSYTAIGTGIGSIETGATATYEKINISNNTITNSPISGITLGFGGGIYTNCLITNNILINPGSSLTITTYSSGVYLAGNSYVGSLSIDNIEILDNFNTTRLALGVFATPAVDSTSCVCVVSLDVKLTGATKTAYIRPMSNVNSRLLPLLKAVQNTPPVLTSHTFKVNSSILDTSADITYRVQVQGSVWTKHLYDSAIPTTGTFQVGSTVINTVPAASGNFGWVCTTAGVPGTWKTFGAIAA